MSSEAPLVITVTVPVSAAAAGTSLTSPVAVAPFAGTVTAAYVTTADLTGANTNSRTINVYNRGSGGSGATLVASKAFTSGVDAPANTKTPITATPTNAVAAGDLIDWESLSVGTGLADPGGLAVITFTKS